ncbi:MAG: aspartate racemase [Thermoplasmata archaeon]|nr:MAG: aspartate racemase [Thermoplasmata archaeon]
MKTIGLIGGTSWNSTLEYYRILNETVKKKLGGSHSAKCILYSIDFEDIRESLNDEKWEDVAKILIDASKRIEKAGADFILICANTLHKIVDDIQENISIPILNIIEVTAEKIKEQGIKKVGLIGTRFTMKEDFYKKILEEKYSIEVVLPDKKDIETLHGIISDELCKGIVKQGSKERIKKIINNLTSRRAEGIILGCTELPLLIKQEDIDMPIFDTTRIHAISAVECALEN